MSYLSVKVHLCNEREGRLCKYEEKLILISWCESSYAAFVIVLADAVSQKIFYSNFSGKLTSSL